VIHRTPEGNLLIYKFMPLEIATHLTALGLLAFYFQNFLDNPDFKFILYGLVSISIVRLVMLYSTRAFDSDPVEAAERKTRLMLYAGSLLSGCAWSGALLRLSLTTPGISFNNPIFPVTISGILLATLAGSALSARFFAAFALPCLAILLFYSAYTQTLQSTAVWAFLTIVVMLLYTVSARLEAIFSRYRSLSRQNTGLLQDLAAAKQQAESHKITIENANEALKKEIAERKAAEEKIRASERETARILQDMQDTYFHVDGNGTIVRISPSVQYLMGRPAPNLVATQFSELFPEKEVYQELLVALGENGGVVQNYEMRLRHLMGSDLWVSINAHCSNNTFDVSNGFEGTIRDITITRLATEALHREKERLHVTLESIGDGVIATDVNRNVEFLNPVAQWMTGWSEEDARGKSISTVFSLVDEESNKLIVLPLDQWLQEGKKTELDNPVVLLNKNQERTYSIEVKGSSICDITGKIFGTVLVFRNVSKLHTLTKQLSYQASHDALTGLINRKEFESRARQAINSAQKDGKTHALCYVDLDQFKIVNDTCGHYAGDELLIQLTNLLKGTLRESDTLARLGGDEFGLLLVGCPLDKAELMAENIRAMVEKFRFIWEERVFRVGASIGLVAITPETTGLMELLSAADSACYIAKENGRNQVHLYRQNDRAVEDRNGQMQWTHRIQSALEENRFELHFQTIFSIQESRQSGLNGEILLRMVEKSSSREKKLILPTAFIPAAERYQLMPQIDQWVIGTALSLLKDRDFGATQLEMCFINLSGQSIGDARILDVIINTLESTGVPPEILCFEMSESSVIANLDSATQFISVLKNMGCCFALDDFGTSLSSFAYLKNLAVDFLKLDGELVKDVATDKASHAMVDAINRVAHVMGMKTVVEHVESDETLQTLQLIGIDYAQGFGIEPPVPFKWAPLPVTPLPVIKVS